MLSTLIKTAGFVDLEKKNPTVNAIALSVKRIAPLAKRRFCRTLVLQNQLAKELIAEFFACTFMMTLGIGCTCTFTLSRGVSGNIMSLDIGWAMTFIFAVLICGRVTGGHINPAVSLAFACVGRLPWYKLPSYILAQCFGAFAGSAIAFGIYYDAFQSFDNGNLMVSGVNGTANLFATYPQLFLTTGGGFANEVLATCILMICIMAITDKENSGIPTFLVPLFVGLAILLLSCSYCHNNGCAMNPARDFGPRVFTSIAGWGIGVFSFRNYNWFWVPIVGPFCGGPLGALAYNFFIGNHVSREKNCPALSRKRTSSILMDDFDKKELRSPATLSKCDIVADTSPILPMKNLSNSNLRLRSATSTVYLSKPELESHLATPFESSDTTFILN